MTLLVCNACVNRASQGDNDIQAVMNVPTRALPADGVTQGNVTVQIVLPNDMVTADFNVVLHSNSSAAEISQPRQVSPNMWQAEVRSSDPGTLQLTASLVSDTQTITLPVYGVITFEAPSVLAGGMIVLEAALIDTDEAQFQIVPSQ